MGRLTAMATRRASVVCVLVSTRWITQCKVQTNEIVRSIAISRLFREMCGVEGLGQLESSREYCSRLFTATGGIS